MADTKKTARQLGAMKRPQTWKPGQSGNPKGGPKRGMSVKEAYDWALSLNAEDMAAILEAGGKTELSESFKRLPKGFELKVLWAARILAAVMFDPQPGLVNHVVERLEGKIAQPITQMTDAELKQFIASTIGIDLSGDAGSAAARPDSADSV